MLFSSKLGRVVKISSLIRRNIKYSSSIPSPFNRREKIYEKAIQQCRVASENMKKITENNPKYPRNFVNPYLRRFICDQGDWCREFKVSSSHFGPNHKPVTGDIISPKNILREKWDLNTQGRREKSTSRPFLETPCEIIKNDGVLEGVEMECKKKDDPCKKKGEDPCKKKKDDPCKKKEDPCKKKKEDPCKKKKDDPCKKKDDPCKKRKDDPCKKKKDDPCKKKEDPCKKKKDDPCKKKEDPCKKKKDDPCKKKDDPSKKKKDDPCKKKDDPSKKKKDDPCKKKKDDPCKKKEDPCKKKKDDPCKKKEDPCKKNKKCSSEEMDPYKPRSCKPSSSDPCQSPRKSSYPIINDPCPNKPPTKTSSCPISTCSVVNTDNFEPECPVEEKEVSPDIFEQVDVLDCEKLTNAEEAFGDCYKNKEYYSYNNMSFYDIYTFLRCERQTPPSALPSKSQGNEQECDL